MSKTVHIESSAQFESIISSSTVVVTDFYADWCGPCKAIAPIYEQLSSQLSRPNKITFTKVNTDTQKQIAQNYMIRAMPTFLVFKNKQEVTRIEGANKNKLSEAVKKLAAEAEGGTSGGFTGGESSGGGGGATWLGAEVTRGFSDITSEIDLKDLDVLNADPELGNARTLFETSRPSALAGKDKASSSGSKDWVESDTDEQLMIYVPCSATLKIHSLHITSLPAASEADEPPMRPKTLRLFTNRSNNLGFEEAEDSTPEQEIVLQEKDWSEEGTAKVELRFVRFQKVTSLVIFVVDGDGSSDKTRIDRIRVIGEAGAKRDMGKLEKFGEAGGE